MSRAEIRVNQRQISTRHLVSAFASSIVVERTCLRNHGESSLRALGREPENYSGDSIWRPESGGDQEHERL